MQDDDVQGDLKKKQSELPAIGGGIDKAQAAKDIAKRENQYLKEEREALDKKKPDFASASDIKKADETPNKDNEILDYGDIDKDIDATPKKHNTEDEKPLDVDNIWFSTEFSYFGESEEEHEKISR